MRVGPLLYRLIPQKKKSIQTLLHILKFLKAYSGLIENRWPFSVSHLRLSLTQNHMCVNKEDTRASETGKERMKRGKIEAIERNERNE